MAEHRAGWRIEVKTRPEGTKGFTPLEKRWVIERTNAWHGRFRRNSKDYERSVESSTAMLQMSNSPFAQSTSYILNFKLPIEISTQPQPLQDGFLHP